MKVFNVAYIPHTKEDHPEVRAEEFGWLTQAEDEFYRKHLEAGLEGEYIDKLLKEADSDMTDEDLYYILAQGTDAAMDVYTGCDDSICVPFVGCIYRGLVYDDDLAIVIDEVL